MRFGGPRLAGSRVFLAGARGRQLERAVCGVCESDHAARLRLPATLDVVNPVVEEDGLLRVRARLHKTA